MKRNTQHRYAPRTESKNATELRVAGSVFYVKFIQQHLAAKNISFFS